VWKWYFYKNSTHKKNCKNADFWLFDKLVRKGKQFMKRGKYPKNIGGVNGEKEGFVRNAGNGAGIRNDGCWV
jgi:hypothetical protein